MARPLQPIAERFPRPAVNRAKHCLGIALSYDLDALARLWGTDKASTGLAYTAPYAAHLRSRRWRVRSVLEIGVGGYGFTNCGGESMRMWRNYFPRAHVYGVDLESKRLDATARMTILQADQSDPESLRAALAGCPPFDLIVDDGSHVGAHVITTFETLFERLVPGGLYAIEDLLTSYDPGYGGGPPGIEGTGLALARTLLDDLNLRRRPIAAIHAYEQLVIVEKSGA